MLRNYYLWCFFFVTACFVTDIDAREAIVGGHAARKYQFKYMASVQIHGQHVCGGAIIDDYFVLTAAHCVIGKKDEPVKDPIFVLVGTNHRHDYDFPAVTTGVQTVYVPKEYNQKEAVSTGDIALLKMIRSLKVEERKVYLAKVRVNPTQTLKKIVGQTVYVIGFGWNVITMKKHLKIGFDGHSSDNLLHFAEATLLDNIECSDMLKGNRYLHHEKEFCVQVKQGDHDRHGTCEGDSGSPLISKDRLLLGILTGVPDHCSEREIPGIYVRISFYARIIVDVVVGRADSKDVNIYTLKDT